MKIYGFLESPDMMACDITIWEQVLVIINKTEQRTEQKWKN